MTSTFEHRDPDDSLDDSLNDLPPGKFLGRYQITRLIGRGGMGCVYEAVHRDLGKRVAIKTLLPSLAASEEARGRFLREGQAASRIRHPHVVDVTDVVAEGPVSYLVMEYLEGEDLSSLIERQGALPLAEAADVLLPVIAAIAAAHELGVIHRDLKPENIFLARTSFGGPCPKVVDFGISKVLGDPTAIALTATSAVFGTMYYLPPEQLGGSREADARGDQYALGTILYECVTGHRAFEGTSIYGVLKSVAEGVYPPARSWRPDLPPRLETAIDRAMRLNPAARFASVRMLGAELLPHASPAVRAVWTPVFGDGGEHPRAGRHRGRRRRRGAGARGHRHDAVARGRRNRDVSAEARSRRRRRRRSGPRCRQRSRRRGDAAAAIVGGALGGDRRGAGAGGGGGGERRAADRSADRAAGSGVAAAAARGFTGASAAADSCGPGHPATTGSASDSAARRAAARRAIDAP